MLGIQTRLHFGRCKGVHYHCLDFQSGRQPQEWNEIFSYRSSLLRNVIERCFDIWKARGLYSSRWLSFNFRHKELIVIASTVVHNFIRENASIDQECWPYEENEDYTSAEDTNVAFDPVANNLKSQQQEREMSMECDENCNVVLQSLSTSKSIIRMFYLI